MTYEKIKPIPKYILKKIERMDKQKYEKQDGMTRFYSYLTKNDGELVKVTVAVKCRYKKWYCKQVAVHGLRSDKCFVKDMIYTIMGGHFVGWHAEGLTKHPKWYEDDEWGWGWDRYFDPHAPLVNREYIEKFPEYKYSAFDLYPCSDSIKYLRQYEKYPEIEMLVKLGLDRYVYRKMLLDKIREDKAFRKWLYANAKEIGNNHYYVSTILGAYKSRMPLKVLQGIERVRKNLDTEREMKPIRDMVKGEKEKFVRYLIAQNAELSLYLDYHKACTFLGLDMNLPKNRYPHNFKFWHDTRIDEYRTARAKADEEHRRELYEQFSAVVTKYLPMEDMRKGAYIVMIAKSPDELVTEGETLCHCVGRGNYDQRVAREESLIFFVRKAEDPKTPLITIEFNIKSKKMLQCYGKGNTSPSEEAKAFIEGTWLPYAKRKLRKIAA